jgi:DNA-binding CsgD family transcriptional regulator
MRLIMENRLQDYSLYYKFIENYAPTGYKDIDPHDPFIRNLEKATGAGDQFFYIGDLIGMNIIHTSRRSLDMIGIEPAMLTPYHFFDATHPDDIQRLTIGRAKLLKMAYELFMLKKGFSLLSTNFHMKDKAGKYTNYLVQLYLFYAEVPYKSVFVLKVHTDIAWFKMSRNSFHYYLGNNPSMFRYPDEELLRASIPFSHREFEIIRLIETGLSSREIADKIFLSVNTVNTHRRNILSKTGHGSMPELIYDLVERGVL